MTNHDLATPVDRLIAQFLDSLVAILVIVVSTILTLFSSKLGEILGLLGLAAAFLYILCADGLEGGQSYGKRALGICVIDATSGRSCTFLQSFIRNIPLSLLGVIDWIFIFTERRQRLGDLFANTIVVRSESRSDFY
jgi:uncharacterized RDD family membrane protein YckC